MKRAQRGFWRLGLGTVMLMPALLPTSCSRTVLRELTPFLMDGSNSALHDLLFFAAPFVLP